MGVDKRILEKSGAWYSYKGERLGQGREAVRDFLKTNPSIAKEIEAKIRETAGVPGKGSDKRAEPADVKSEKVDRKSESRHEDKRGHSARVTT